MKFGKLWTLVWAGSGELVPGLDDGADGMLIRTEEAAIAEAARQAEMYAEDPQDIIAVPVEIDDSVSVPCSDSPA